MASCFDISIIDAWNTGDENVIDGSVDDYDFDWGSGTPEENPPCRCRRTCCTRTPEEQTSFDETTCAEEEASAEDEEDYPVVQL